MQKKANACIYAQYEVTDASLDSAKRIGTDLFFADGITLCNPMNPAIAQTFFRGTVVTLWRKDAACKYEIWAIRAPAGGRQVFLYVVQVVADQPTDTLPLEVPLSQVTSVADCASMLSEKGQQWYTKWMKLHEEDVAKNSTKPAKQKKTSHPATAAAKPAAPHASLLSSVLDSHRQIIDLLTQTRAEIADIKAALAKHHEHMDKKLDNTLTKAGQDLKELRMASITARSAH